MGKPLVGSNQTYLTSRVVKCTKHPISSGIIDILLKDSCSSLIHVNLIILTKTSYQVSNYRKTVCNVYTNNQYFLHVL